MGVGDFFTGAFSYFYKSEKINGLARSPVFTKNQVFPVENNFVYLVIIVYFFLLTILATALIFKKV